MRSHDSSRMDETDPVGGAESFQVRRQQCRARQMPKAEFQREVERPLEATICGKAVSNYL
jgi:hypothetical protein